MDLLPQIKRTPQRVIDVFSDAEIEDLMSLPLIDSVLMTILIEGGLRKSEASNLQVRRLGLDEPPSIVVVAGKGGKDRLIPMNARLQQAVNELLLIEHLEPEDHLWYTRPGGGRLQRSTPIGKGSFAVWWARCLAEAGVRYRNPHTARHTFATRWPTWWPTRNAEPRDGAREHRDDALPVRLPRYVGHPHRRRPNRCPDLNEASRKSPEGQ